MSGSWLCSEVVARIRPCVPRSANAMGKSYELEDMADRLVRDVVKLDWVTRHAAVRPYTKNATMFGLLKKRFSPDEWIHGECTGVKINSSEPIRLWEYPHGRKNELPKLKQRRMEDYFDMLPKN